MERIPVDHNVKSAIGKAVETLRAGGVVIYPTETIYGLAVDATNPTAVAKLLKIKERPAGKAISILVTNAEMAKQYVDFTANISQLVDRFLPGPLTVIGKSAGKVDKAIESENGTLGFRISSYPLAAELVETAAIPLTATSANPAGKARPYSPDKLIAQFSESQLALIDCMLDAGPLPLNEPSTVIDTTTDVQEVVRSGELSAEIAPPIPSASEDETMEAASKMVKQYHHVLNEKPLIFLLEGDMGAGKTQFAKGLAKGLGIPSVVSSPTYNLAKEYRFDGGLFVHMDLWRAGQVTADQVGMRSRIQPRVVSAVEWPEPLLPYFRTLGDVAVVVRVHLSGSHDQRTIRILAL
jgi:L-threonylcarbamoyladenylate synthase